MKDLGEALETKIEQIVEHWVTSVYDASVIETAQLLPYQAVRNSLPEVLKELSLLLSRFHAGNHQALEDRSFFHGLIRAQQGYDAPEIVREYQLLREAILDALEAELLQGTPVEVLSAVRLIDSFLNEIITASLESYIEERLAELERLQSQLTLTNQELTRLLQVQKENLSFMVHEIKNPLNSIIGHSNVMLQKQRQTLKAKASDTNLAQLERVLRNGRKVLKLVNDALEITRYDRGQLQLNLETVELSSLITELLADVLEPAASAKAIALVAEIDQAPPQIVSDSLRLQQIITNLVSNAIRYTETGSVRLVCKQPSPQAWSLAVIDTGIGIAPEHQVSIFEAYSQVENSDKNNDGSGLGLAIVKQIVNLMHGTIDLTSQLGEGTAITVTLPIDLSSHPPASVASPTE